MLLKGKDGNIKIFNPIVTVGGSNNLGNSKFWIVFNRQTQNIEIYKVATMKLYQILPFHYFDIYGIKWNWDQSLLPLLEMVTIACLNEFNFILSINK